MFLLLVAMLVSLSCHCSQLIAASLNHLYAGAGCGDTCLKGLNGVPDIVGCSFVQSTVTEQSFFASKINSPHRPASREEEAGAGNKEQVWVLILAADHKCCEKLWAEFAASTGGIKG